MSDPNSFGGNPAGGMWQKPEDLVGQVLADRYQVQHVLGEGGMGSVYLGEHITLRKRVAIKVLHQELCRDQTQVDRFLQEARAASMIGHENIVDIVDFGPVPGGSVFFAMEYLEGEDLADTLRREGRIKWSRARPIMLQVVRALRAAHEKGIIHRDLKPANCFLVKRSDGRDFIKLLDFGIAKVTDPNSEAGGGGLTRTGAVFGTAKYMAPEQACGEPADHRTDIYAAAICLYEFLTGQVPYDGDNFMRVLSRHLTEPLTLPSTAAPDAGISPAVEAVIVKALSKKPDDRYQGMGEFEAAMLAIGPDGNLINQVYEGPPSAGPGFTQPAHEEGIVEGPGSTVWLQPAQGSQGPGSQPPEGRGGTLLLDAQRIAHHAPEEGEYGTVKLGQPEWAQQGAPPPAAANPESTYMMEGMGRDMLPTGGGPGSSAITNHPPVGRPPTGAPPVMGARPVSVPPGTSAPPGHAPTSAPPPNTGDYTMFATEKRSPAKFIAMIVGGAVGAILLGGLVAFVLLDDPEPTAQAELPEPTEVQKPVVSQDPDPPPEIKADPPEIPKEPDPPPEEPPPEEPPPDPPPETKKQPPPRKGGGRKKIKAKLDSKDETRGFAKAKKAATKCGVGLPMTVKVKVTINSDGRVIGIDVLQGNPNLPAVKCVVKAVRNKARFIKTETAIHFATRSFRLQ